MSPDKSFFYLNLSKSQMKSWIPYLGTFITFSTNSWENSGIRVELYLLTSTYKVLTTPPVFACPRTSDNALGRSMFTGGKSGSSTSLSELRNIWNISSNFYNLFQSHDSMKSLLKKFCDRATQDTQYKNNDFWTGFFDSFLFLTINRLVFLIWKRFHMFISVFLTI